MSEFVPNNDLDRALIAIGRSRSAMPDLYRALSEGELWFLVPYHPEVEEGVVELRAGMPLPFVRIGLGEEAIVPLFSSSERALEGMESGGVRPRTYSPAAMPARQVLEILGATPLHAVINKGCATGEVTIPPELMRDLANGRALQPRRGVAAEESANVTPLDPADYPTDLIQPAFEILREHREFRAAWIFGTPSECAAEGKPRYRIMVLMDPLDETILHDLDIVVQMACPATCTVEMGRLEPDDAEMIARVFALAPAFFVAVDYQPPPGARH